MKALITLFFIFGFFLYPSYSFSNKGVTLQSKELNEEECKDLVAQILGRVLI